MIAKALALEADERYTITVAPEVALYFIDSLYAMYSLHVEVNEANTGIVIHVKNKPDKKTLHISKRARLILEKYLS